MGICHGAGGEQRAGWGSRYGSAVAEWGTLGAVRASEKGARVPGGTGFGVRHVSEERVSGSRNSVCYPPRAQPRQELQGMVAMGSGEPEA